MMANTDALMARLNNTVDSSKYRDGRLKFVFKRVDFDGSGYIDAAELMKLGHSRRMSGHKQCDWTAERNDALVKKIDINGDGRISADEFTRHFNCALPRDKEAVTPNT